MARFLLCILFFPLNWVRFTVDIHRLAWRWLLYHLFHRYAEVPCFYCQGRDNGRSPRPVPRGIRKYRNQWLIRPWLPCIVHYPKYGSLCHGEGGYLNVRAWVVPMAFLISLLWLAGMVWVVTHL